MSSDQRIPFTADGFFHLHYHSDGKPIFQIDGNYMFFLVRLNKIIKPVGQVYAYCLMPQDIHLLIKTRSREALFEQFLDAEEGKTVDQFDPDPLIQEHLDELKNVYTAAVQKLFKEDEPVFGHYFHKTELEDDLAVLQCIREIHLSPLRARLATTPKDWKHSSYVNIARENRTFEMGAAVLELFGGKEHYLSYHLPTEGDH